MKLLNQSFDNSGTKTILSRANRVSDKILNLQHLEELSLGVKRQIISKITNLMFQFLKEMSIEASRDQIVAGRNC